MHDALKNSYLAKLQLSFHTVDGSPPSESNLLEAYTLAFTYGDNTGVTHIDVETKEGGSQSAQTIILLDAKNELKAFFTNVYGFFSNHTRDGRLQSYPLPREWRSTKSIIVEGLKYSKFRQLPNDHVDEVS